jgi:hypothetical protein
MCDISSLPYQLSSFNYKWRLNAPLTNLIPHILPETAKLSSPSPFASAVVDNDPISDLGRNFNLDLVTRYIEFGLVDGRTSAPIPSRGRVESSSGRLKDFVRSADVILLVMVVEGWVQVDF